MVLTGSARRFVQASGTVAPASDAGQSQTPGFTTYSGSTLHTTMTVANADAKRKVKITKITGKVGATGTGNIEAQRGAEMAYRVYYVGSDGANVYLTDFVVLGSYLRIGALNGCPAAGAGQFVTASPNIVGPPGRDLAVEHHVRRVGPSTEVSSVCSGERRMEWVALKRRVIA